MASSKSSTPSTFTHWSRPRSRMYDYNYEYAASYYRPQVNYIGSTFDSKSRVSRRRTVSPPGAKTFSERWAANPFYGRYEPISEYEYSRSMQRGKSRLVRGSSVPDTSFYEQDASAGRGYSVSRARSISRERSVYREESVATTRRARSVTRAQSVVRASSMSRAGSVYEGDYDDSRSVRGASRSYNNDGYYYDPLNEEEWQKLVKIANKDEREKSIFQLRMSLENPRDLPKKKSMQTTVGHGLYKSNLYGTITWDPEPYISGGDIRSGRQ